MWTSNNIRHHEQDAWDRFFFIQLFHVKLSYTTRKLWIRFHKLVETRSTFSYEWLLTIIPFNPQKSEIINAEPWTRRNKLCSSSLHWVHSKVFWVRFLLVKDLTSTGNTEEVIHQSSIAREADKALLAIHNTHLDTPAATNNMCQTLKGNSSYLRRCGAARARYGSSSCPYWSLLVFLM